jgi:hypothetical protein
MNKYAVAIQKQGLYAQTKVGDFIYVTEYDRHIWMGQIASNMEELAEQTNAAIKSVMNFGDPWQTLEVIQVEKGELVPELSFETPTPLPRPRKLKVVGQTMRPDTITSGQTCEEVLTA